MADVFGMLGEMGGTSWFPGYLPVSIIKPYGKWSGLKLLKRLALMDPRFVSYFAWYSAYKFIFDFHIVRTPIHEHITDIN